MIYNGETNGQDLYSDCRYLVSLDETSDTTSYPIKAFTRNANMALDKIIAFILRADNLWQFDDTNQTGELLDVSSNLVSGTQKYLLSISWLKIGRVRIKDSAGNWITMLPIERAALNDSILTQTAGDPRRYDLLGNYLYLYPAPNYSSSAGLEVQFQRGASYFVPTDTTKAPGFATQFHRLISLYAALDYCQINGMAQRAGELQVMIGTPPDLMNNQAGSGMIKDLMDFYSARDVDMKVTLRPVRDDYGQMSLNPGSGNFPNGSTMNEKGF